jgi:Flp pilus assembly protein TadG
MNKAANFRQLLREFKSSEEGVYAVEAALLAPVLIFFTMLAINFGMAYNMKLRLVTAAGAGIAYAQKNGASVTPSTFASFTNSIAGVVQSSANFGGTPPMVDVRINNSSGSAAGQYYCVTGSPPAWSQAADASTNCGNGVTASQFVTLTLSTSANNFFPTAGIVGSVIQEQETIVARIQ